MELADGATVELADGATVALADGAPVELADRATVELAYRGMDSTMGDELGIILMAKSTVYLILDPRGSVHWRISF